MILKREDEIRNFKPKDYYTLDILTEKGGNYLKLSWHDKNNSTSTFNKEKIENIKKKVLNKDLKIVDVKKSNKKKYAPSLYDLTELQRDANKMFGYSAKETLSIMQKLYEHHKVLTYPRTDSRYLTDDIVDTLKDRIKAVNTSEYSKVCMKLLKTKIKPNKSFVDNSKVTDHHAIIPTEERVFLGDLSDKERKIYDLVVKRFLSVLCPPFEYEQTTIKGSCEGETFTAKGNKIIKLGWRENYTVDDNETYDGIIDINVDEVLKVESVKIENKKTNPPSYLNEATLLTEMEKHNLGTVATRADIIEKLFNSFVVEKKGKDIKVIDIHEVSVIADYFVIASASNQNQVQAMVDNVDETLGRAGFEAKQIEGTRNSSWVLMDYGDMIVHVFDEENRLFYDLERIWRDGKVLDVNEFLEK